MALVSRKGPARSEFYNRSEMLHVERLRDTLRDVMRRRTCDFSGIGIVVCDYPEVLPFVPLSKVTTAFDGQDLVSRLVEIASRRSEHHDGFHVISTAWRLTKVAQYFSPPIISGAEIDRSKRFGGRYLAALFGSAIPKVMLSGIASEGFGIAVFCGGKEVFFEELN
ncbi:hypothetical protein JQ600_09840 [Bradyrhizobium sp. AUGA SZCCT0176]|uniref:hypothetical protein n=1 Tax=Bradyrhizobium sp. AUGA SZCCT0176 TaxID=2807664 RepID=UPI001BACE236|nr:hypothetical protein [Bradyrhizobium sp. AUGA SZCCT0176]MBR1225218.1 hypothetical protein [Bradyrhizobium sp. AUGA SZCCT0176]